MYVQHIWTDREFDMRQSCIFIRLLTTRTQETSASLCTSVCRNYVTLAEWDLSFRSSSMDMKRFCIFCKLNVILRFLSLFVLDRRKDPNEYADKILWNVNLTVESVVQNQKYLLLCSELLKTRRESQEQNSALKRSWPSGLSERTAQLIILDIWTQYTEIRLNCPVVHRFLLQGWIM